MSASGQAFRLYIVLASPDIAAVFDRVRVLGLAVRCARLRGVDDNGIFLVIDLAAVEGGPVMTLAARLRQTPAVRRVRAQQRS